MPKNEMANPMDEWSLVAVDCDVIVESVESASDAGLSLPLGQT